MSDDTAHAQEPAAWFLWDEEWKCYQQLADDFDREELPEAIPLYASPRSPAASDIPERFKHEVAAIANELGMDHQDLTTGKIAEFARKLRAERDQAISQVEKLTTALRFYADSKRYEGPNLSPIPDDPYAPEEAAYRWDVTRDHGRIASRALTSTMLGPEVKP